MHPPTTAVANPHPPAAIVIIMNSASPSPAKLPQANIDHPFVRFDFLFDVSSILRARQCREYHADLASCERFSGFALISYD